MQAEVGGIAVEDEDLGQVAAQVVEVLDVVPLDRVRRLLEQAVGDVQLERID